MTKTGETELMAGLLMYIGSKYEKLNKEINESRQDDPIPDFAVSTMGENHDGTWAFIELPTGDRYKVTIKWVGDRESLGNETL